MSSAHEKFHEFCKKQFLPLMFATAITLGLAVPSIGNGLAGLQLRGVRIVPTAAVCYIFLVQGLTLQSSEVVSALRAVKPLLFGLISILVITPLLGAAVLFVLPAFDRGELRIGFLLISCMPTTVNSGVALAGSAGGNVALALLLTVASNTIGIFTVPFCLSCLISEAGGDVALDPVPMLLKLVLNILVPICLGRLFQCHVGIQRHASRYKTALSASCAAALATIPLIEISSSAAIIKTLEPASLLAIILVAILIHATFLTWNLLATRCLRFPDAMRRSVVIMASEKAITVAAAILPLLPDSVGTRGIVIIPVILGHFAQIAIDACIVSSWARAAPVTIPGWTSEYACKR